jgi:hypothetical protein
MLLEGIIDPLTLKKILRIKELLTELDMLNKELEQDPMLYYSTPFFAKQNGVAQELHHLGHGLIQDGKEDILRQIPFES